MFQREKPKFDKLLIVEINICGESGGMEKPKKKAYI
jgi:hypothetical protein